MTAIQCGCRQSAPTSEYPNNIYTIHYEKPENTIKQKTDFLGEGGGINPPEISLYG